MTTMTTSIKVERLQAISSHLSTQPTISFIGGGNMAEAILGGLHASGHVGSKLKYSEPFAERLSYMQTKYPELNGSADNFQAIEGADVVILAVKPQVLRQVLSSCATALLKNPNTLIISIAAGITTQDIYKWMNTDQPASIVRCMPNTPSLLGEGAIGLYATESVSQQQRMASENIMRAVAKEVLWVDNEALIDSVTGISGSGPAYFFLIMEAMQNAGIAAGLTPEDAKALTLQTCLGATRMAQTSEDDLATLRRKVTSPKGTTEAAINSMEANNIRQIMKDAVFAAADRGRELSKELGQN
ncbi:pyrroline-5-carboxylate reductase [Halteromyces radiatus]|uniref:pyrroline-5-carboxylate reductase n=1 Tax=Halteromyces radiatus TaxID=101107 RepID=UPI00221F8764|nr:pyrroline-5-carboxylate reductase [Halteromyces radiatus]KAI8097739.1 pyrroline-5-carboxylate reductase [Halteromyces radiatus]